MVEPYYSDDMVTLHVGDCLDVLKEMPDASVDAVVTDPPAGISFMGKAWDADKGGRTVWVAWLTDVMREAVRVLKPGGHALVWALPRTSHWTATALEDAGFTIRDCVVHIFGSGFPKSLDVSKAIDKAAGAEREVIGAGRWAGRESAADLGVMNDDTWQGGAARVATAPTTEGAARWNGWGTALKPSQEHWWLCRKPLDGTVAANVLEHGTGALNIGACRVEPTGESRPRVAEASQERRYTDKGGTNFAPLPGMRGVAPEGRWPTSLVFTHSQGCVEDGPCQPDCPVAELDRQSGVRTSGLYEPHHKRNVPRLGHGGTYGEDAGRQRETPTYGDSGGASRFFPAFRYEAKAPASERPKLPDGTAWPTVKPVALMRWLVRLVTPPGGLVLDPFAGSGTTGEACVLEGFRAVLVDQDPTAAELIRTRLAKPLQPSLDLFASDTPAPLPDIPLTEKETNHGP